VITPPHPRHVETLKTRLGEVRVLRKSVEGI